LPQREEFEATLRYSLRGEGLEVTLSGNDTLPAARAEAVLRLLGEPVAQTPLLCERD
jgi:hypothetical protein